jgi:hypothetical protein
MKKKQKLNKTNLDFQTMRVNSMRLLADAPYAASVPPAVPAKTKETVRL